MKRTASGGLRCTAWTCGSTPSPSTPPKLPLLRGCTSLRRTGGSMYDSDPNVPEPDIKEMVDQSADRFQAMNASLSLLMWGLRVYRREEDTAHDPGQWRQRLQEARCASVGNGSGDNQHDLNRGGPGFVAAVCVRDHWEEMSDDERDWCLNLVCSEVEREGDHWNQLARVQRSFMSADRPCAWVLPILVGKSRGDTQRTRVRQVLVVALTHAIDQVRWYAAFGIGSHLWAIDRELALRCVNALATEAMMVQQAADAEAGRPYAGRRQLDDIEAEAASLVRQRFFEADAIANDAYQTLDTTQWFGAEADGRILAILGQARLSPRRSRHFSGLRTRSSRGGTRMTTANKTGTSGGVSETTRRSQRFAISSRTSCSGHRPQRQPRSSSPSWTPSIVTLGRSTGSSEDLSASKTASRIHHSSGRSGSCSPTRSDVRNGSAGLTANTREETRCFRLFSSEYRGRTRFATGEAWRGTPSTSTPCSRICRRLRRFWTTTSGSSTTSESNRSPGRSSGSRSVSSRETLSKC